MAEFALVLPSCCGDVAIVMADFGRIFAGMITLESATRNAAEAAANLYIAAAPGALNAPAPTGNPSYYDALHSKAAQVVCNDITASRTRTTTARRTPVRTCHS